MDHFIAFAQLNWYLFAALFVIVVLLVSSAVQSRMSGVSAIGTQVLLRLNNDDLAIVVDVRDQANFRKGHISNSINLPTNEINDESIANLVAKYQDRSVILVCQTGVRSAKAASLFKKAALGRIYTLTAGIDGWKQEHLPLSKNK